MGILVGHEIKSGLVVCKNTEALRLMHGYSPLFTSYTPAFSE